MPQLPVLSVAQAASQTGLPKRTIQWACANGKLRAHKFDGVTAAYVIHQDDLDAYMAERQAS